MRFVLMLFMTVVSVLANAAIAAERVLVFGGTGKLGAYIVADLVQAGDDVTVFARSTSDRSRLKSLDVDYAIGNLDNDKEIASAIESGKFAVLIDASGRRADVFSYDHGQAMRQIVKSSEKADHVASTSHATRRGVTSVPWPGTLKRLSARFRLIEDTTRSFSVNTPRVRRHNVVCLHSVASH